jgi:hypothetical protein
MRTNRVCIICYKKFGCNSVKLNKQMTCNTDNCDNVCPINKIQVSDTCPECQSKTGNGRK